MPRASLEKAITDNPDDPEAYLILADQALAAGHTAEMEALLQMVTPLVESYSANATRKRDFLLRTYAGRAIAAERRGRSADAVTDLKKWIAEDPESASARQRLGTALFLAAETDADYAAAILELEAAQKIEPKLASPQVTAALLYHRKGEAEKAKAAFETAVRSGANDAGTMKTYGRWLLEIGNSAAAKAPLAKARSLEPNAVDTLIYSGIAARINGNLAEAEKHLLAALSIAPSNRDAINQLAALLIMDDDVAKRDRALQYAQINAQLFPKRADQAFTLAWVYYQRQQLREAQAALRKAQSLGSYNSDSSYFIAKMQFDQDKIDTAKALLNNAMKNKGLFIHRQEAESLLEMIEKRDGQ